MEYIIVDPSAGQVSSRLAGIKRKTGNNYNDTLVIHSNKATKADTATATGGMATKVTKKNKMKKKSKKVVGEKLTKAAIKKLMAPEVKYVDMMNSFYNNTGNNTMVSFCVNGPIVKGTGINERIGNKVQLVGLDCKISALQTIYKGTGTNPVNFPQSIEYLIIQLKGQGAANLLIGDIKDIGVITEYWLSYHAKLGTKKIKVLHRGVIDVDGTTGENNYREFHIPLKMTTTYNNSATATYADIQENGLWLVFLTPSDGYMTTGTGLTTTAIYPTVNYSTRLKYIDC